MAFTEIEKLKAVAIVHIFETSRAFGNYAAYAVLNDGAGISYGINQFTHRSGSLIAVIDQYISRGGRIGTAVFKDNLARLRSNSPNVIRRAAADKHLKKALISAAATKEMRAAQHAVAFERYLRPAIAACAGSQFVTPLALAVVYDSINHGSWEKIRDRVLLPKPASRLATARLKFEKAWISEYLRKRREWLRGIPRLRPTTYRTAFFLVQIERRNWNLELPLIVHGTYLTKAHFSDEAKSSGAILNASKVDFLKTSAVSPNIPPDPSKTDRPRVRAIPAATQPVQGRKSGEAQVLDGVQERVDKAAAAYDQIEAIVRTVLTRTDAAKSLWTTVVGTVWQSAWAVASFAIGLPNEIWLVVALIVAALMLFYLYRQLVLGKIRETASVQIDTAKIINETKTNFKN